jgi:hypothetical protein
VALSSQTLMLAEVIKTMPNKSPSPTPDPSARSFTPKADAAVVSRQVGIPVANRRRLNYVRHRSHHL